MLRAEDGSDAFAVVSGRELLAGAVADAGCAYHFDDRDVLAGTSYSYRLVAVERNGTERSFGPLRVLVNAVAPAAISLHPCRPNPMPDETTVAFDLPEAGWVEAMVYDASGRRVKQLIAGTYSAGTHALSWAGSDESGVRLAAGVYFVRMQTGSWAGVQKVVLAP